MTPDDYIDPDDTLSHALGSAAEQMPARARNRVRRQVLHAARANARRRWFAGVSRRFAVGMTVASVLGGGFAYATETSLPGDLLYGVKRGAEDALVAILPPGGLEHRVLVGLAARRAAETAALARRGVDSDLVGESLGELRAAVRQATPADGAMPADDMARIRERAGDAPDATRAAIEGAVSGSDTGTGTPGAQTGPTIGSPDSPSGDTTQDPDGAGGGAPGDGDGGEQSGPGYQNNDDAPGPGN
jgi:hypothetical protein